MKKVTTTDVRELAALARIELTDAQTEQFSGEFEAILGYVDQITELAAKTEEQPSAGTHANVFRADGEPHAPSIHTEALLDAAPLREGAYVKVKKILNQNDG